MKYFALLAAIILFAGCASSTRTLRPTPEPVAAKIERPGLGTGSGEWRALPAHHAYFDRAWDERPSGTAKLFYNDYDGAKSMLDYLGGAAKPASGLLECADGLVRMGLRDGAGHWLDAWDLRGNRIAIGNFGARYEVVLRNESRRRVEVVLSVDGLDVIDGQPASFAKRGYVLAPRETVAVEGFRVGRDGVASFRFVGVGDTFAQRRHHETRNVGLIGLAVFTERWGGTPASATRPEHRAWRIGKTAETLPDA